MLETTARSLCKYLRPRRLGHSQAAQMNMSRLCYQGSRMGKASVAHRCMLVSFGDGDGALWRQWRGGGAGPKGTGRAERGSGCPRMRT
eukprot:8500859-Pyramimonas_sp.AAC.1